MPVVSREPVAALPGSGWTYTFKDHCKCIYVLSLNVTFPMWATIAIIPRWNIIKKGREGQLLFLWFWFWFYIQRGRVIYETWQSDGTYRTAWGSFSVGHMADEIGNIERTPLLTLSLWVRAATPLAWIIAMKMGISPNGLPFPPAILIPSASFGP